MGYLAWGSGKPATDEVRAQFAKAYSLGGRSPRMLWDYGRIISGTKPADAVGVLTELSGLEPERRDVKIELAAAMLNANQPNDAIETLLGLHGCTPEEAPRCMGVASYAYMRLNDRDKAQPAAELYLKYAKTPDDRQRAQRLLDALKRSQAPVSAGVRQLEPRPSTGPDTPPRLIRRPANQSPDTAPASPIRLAGVSTITGSFVEFLCTRDSRQIVLETSTGRKQFAMDDPNKILLIGVKDNKINLNCGEQKPALEIELGYTAAPAGSNSDGLVRSLKFGE